MLLIGSRALVVHGLLTRTPKDYDVIGTYEDIQNFVHSQPNVKSFLPAHDGKKMIAIIDDKIWEFEIAWEGSSGAELLNYVNGKVRDGDWDIFPTVINGELFSIPTLNILYALKMSHRYLKNSPHFLKTMRDIKLLRSHGCSIPDDLKTWFRKREKETYTYAHPKLNVKKGDFFKGDGIKYVYDHDSIHVAMKHLEQPAYTYFKKDGSEVACDKIKFFAATPEARLYSVLEEGYVLALERSQIPYDGKEDKPTARRSFEIALMKVCTSITSGWWREFAWEHYDEVMALYNQDLGYVNRFWEAVRVGIVIKLPEENVK